MIAFDTDIFSLILAGDPKSLARLAAVSGRHFLPIVVAEEILRGRLDAIRKAQGNASKVPLDVAYYWLDKTLRDFGRLSFLSYSPDADLRFQSWREQKVRVGASDLRIAAICVAHNVRLITRNQSDFSKIPGLDVEFWM
ncbi:MAG: type II toxin-antitoxin system VapC family toxin [Planctomycetota bacterium]